jgi:hypothetical protein
VPVGSDEEWPTGDGYLVKRTCQCGVVVEGEFGDSLRSKSDVGQMNEVLCKVIAHNLCVLIACMYEIGMPMPEFAVAG